MGMTGGCLCGQVRYELNAEPAVCINCHCTHCQKQAGSAFSIIVGVPEGSIDLTGNLKIYEDRGESGGGVQRKFCPDCGSPIVSLVASAPGMIWVKAGTLDDTTSLSPAMNIFTKSKQHWLELGDIPAFEAGPSGI